VGKTRGEREEGERGYEGDVILQEVKLPRHELRMESTVLKKNLVHKINKIDQKGFFYLNLNFCYH